MFTLLLTYDSSEWHFTNLPTICYDGKTPLLLKNYEDAKEWKDQLSRANPGCEYEIHQLVKAY